MKEYTAKCPNQLINALEDMLLEVASLEPTILAIAASASSLSEARTAVSPEQQH